MLGFSFELNAKNFWQRYSYAGNYWTRTYPLYLGSDLLARKESRIIKAYMPFVSKSQRRWMFENKPDMAKRWQAETGDKPLPERTTPTKAKKSSDKLKRGMQGKKR